MRYARITPRLLTGAAWAGRRIGLLGGSFNPAHAGHRHVSQLAMARLGLDQVWWLVSPQNPLKPVQGMAGLIQRCAWAQQVADDPRIVVTALESRLGTRHTAVTLALLQRRYPRTDFVWLMGADNLQQIPRWRDWTRIFAAVPVAIYPRAPYSVTALLGKAATRFSRYRVQTGRDLPRQGPGWVFLQGPLHPGSATRIRRQSGDSGQS